MEWVYNRAELLKWLGLDNISIISVINALRPFLHDEDTILVEVAKDGEWLAQQIWYHHDGPIVEIAISDHNPLEAICKVAHKYMWSIKRWEQNP